MRNGSPPTLSPGEFLGSATASASLGFTTTRGEATTRTDSSMMAEAFPKPDVVRRGLIGRGGRGMSLPLEFPDFTPGRWQDMRGPTKVDA